jgi:hypothetical protein
MDNAIQDVTMQMRRLSEILHTTTDNDVGYK